MIGADAAALDVIAMVFMPRRSRAISTEVKKVPPS